MTAAIRRIGIAGAGAWGRALAGAARRAGAEPVLWSRRGAAAGDGAAQDPAVLAATDALLFTVSAQDLEAVAASLAPVLPADLPLVICAKGIARSGDRLLPEVMEQALPGRPVAVLSGPTFAAEVIRGLPTAVTVACRDPALAQRLVAALGSATFRPYATTDVVGVALCGAVKNVIAIACGIVAGRALGENARAALMTRGLAETARLGRALGADPATFSGLAGLGDLSLTATSASSRNYRFGLALGHGESIAAALAAIEGVVEGAATAAAVVGLAARHGIETPISAAVAAIVEQNADIGSVVAELLARPFKFESA
jgi:glycerol-3-phosphate dehydrogenase (NAD(P)+)